VTVSLPIVSKFDPTGVRKAQDALGGFGKTLAGIGVAVAGAFAIRAVFNFASETIRMAEEVQQSEAVLRQVAETTGVFGNEVDAVTKRLIKFANAQEMRLGIDSEVIKVVQAQLLTFKALGATADENGGFFDRATELAFDLAMVLKKDASSGAIMLGKALQDPVKGLTALGKAGVQFTQQQKDQVKALVDSNRELDAQALILREVESQVGGAAAAGALFSDKFRLGLEQIKETIGIALIPSFERFVEFFVTNIVPPLTKFFEEDFPVLVAGFGAAWDGLVEALAPVGAALKEALEIPESANVLESLLDSIANLPESPLFKQLVESMVQLVPSLLMLIPPLTEMVVELIPLLVAALPGLIWFIELLTGLFGADGLAGAINEVTEGQWGWIESVKNFEIAAGIVKTAVEALATPWVALTSAINSAYDALVRWFGLNKTPVPAPSLSNSSKKRAVGGPVSAMDSYMVGERGPELFTPGAGGFITPSNRLGGGSSTNITINVNAGMGANGAQLGQEIVSAIKRYERASGPVFASA
jgi:hypothetical protein